MIRVLLAGEQDIVRIGLKILLDNDPEIKVVAEAKSVIDVYEFLKVHTIDLLLLDLNVMGIDQELLKFQLQKTFPQLKIILIIRYDISDVLYEILKYEADGYLLKNIDVEELIFSIKHVHKGFNYYGHDLAENMYKYIAKSKADTQQLYGLSKTKLSTRELEILQLISEGLTNIEIADKLFLSKRTVEGHRQNLLIKANVNNTASLIKYAVQNNLVK